jgi:hypothetical protein
LTSQGNFPSAVSLVNVAEWKWALQNYGEIDDRFPARNRHADPAVWALLFELLEDRGARRSLFVDTVEVLRAEAVRMNQTQKVKERMERDQNRRWGDIINEHMRAFEQLKVKPENGVAFAEASDVSGALWEDA